MKKKLLVFITLITLISSMCVSVSAADKKKVTLRIEGISNELYYDTVETNAATVEELLNEVDSKEDKISLSINSGYLSAVNSETAGKFGGWDGWLFTVNGVEAASGIVSTEVNDGDSIVLYYGDPYGAGMQYPVADTSKISDGIITFTSSDTTYNADLTTTVKVNPVKDATVKWYTGTEFATYKTDENGQIKIDTEKLTEGTHNFQIEKYSDAGLPLVLRLPSDTSVNVHVDIKAGDNNYLYFVLLAALSGIVVIKLFKNKEQNA